MSKIYIAGPMRGLPYYNFQDFDICKRHIEVRGHHAVSPADLDRAAGFDAMTLPDDHDWYSIPDGFDFAACVRRDLEAIQTCEAYVLLDDWEKSVGARAEKAVADFLGLKRLDPASLEPVTDEVRMTDPMTGGMKGVKDARYDLIPSECLEELANVYGKGALKYSDHNWTKGYKWGYSFGAMMRHAWAFWRGENNDKESGLPHLAHAAWHCMTLMWYSKHGKGTDDRLTHNQKENH